MISSKTSLTDLRLAFTLVSNTLYDKNLSSLCTVRLPVVFGTLVCGSALRVYIPLFLGSHLINFGYTFSLRCHYAAAGAVPPVGNSENADPVPP